MSFDSAYDSAKRAGLIKPKAPLTLAPVMTEREFAALQTVHEVLAVAIEDMEAVLKQPAVYVIDMGCWHEQYIVEHEESGKEIQKCAVCFAGSVMANTCKVDPEESFSEEDFGGDDEELKEALRLRFCALNALRSGYVMAAIEYIHNFGKYSNGTDNTPRLQQAVAAAGKAGLSDWPGKMDGHDSPQDDGEIRVFLKLMRELHAELKAAGI